MTNKEIAISVHNVSKAFRIPHEKISSLRGAFVNLSNMKEKGYFYGNINKIVALDKFSLFDIIDTAKTTRYDPLGMAGFCF